MDLRIEQREREGIRVLDLRGRLVLGDSEALLRAAVVEQLKESHANLILNLAEVAEIDDDALGALVVCHARVRRAGGALKLLNLRGVHMQLFVLMKLEGVFEVFEEEQDAVDSFFPDRAVRRFDILEFVRQQEGNDSR